MVLVFDYKVILKTNPITRFFDSRYVLTCIKTAILNFRYVTRNQLEPIYNGRNFSRIAAMPLGKQGDYTLLYNK